MNISISQLLQQCSYSLFSWVDNYISNLICSSSDVIFSATNCLVSLFDSGLSLWKFVDFSNVNHCNLITFAFMHLQVILMKTCSIEFDCFNDSLYNYTDQQYIINKPIKIYEVKLF